MTNEENTISLSGRAGKSLSAAVVLCIVNTTAASTAKPEKLPF